MSALQSLILTSIPHESNPLHVIPSGVRHLSFPQTCTEGTSDVTTLGDIIGFLGDCSHWTLKHLESLTLASPKDYEKNYQEQYEGDQEYKVETDQAIIETLCKCHGIEVTFGKKEKDVSYMVYLERMVLCV